jgi:hypothetical protein
MAYCDRENTVSQEDTKIAEKSAPAPQAPSGQRVPAAASRYGGSAS